MIRRKVPLLVAVAIWTVAVAEESPLRVRTPTELAPMTVGAALTTSRASPGESISVLIGVRLLPGWHTYAEVPADEPYVATKGLLEPSSGLTPSGDWMTPPSIPDATNPQLKIYASSSDPLIFLHEMRVAESAAGEAQVRVTLRFQTCSAERCLPPTREVFALSLNVIPRRK